MKMRKATIEKNEIDFLIRLLNLINTNTEAVHSIITKLEQPDNVYEETSSKMKGEYFKLLRSLEDRHDLDDIEEDIEGKEPRIGNCECCDD